MRAHADASEVDEFRMGSDFQMRAEALSLEVQGLSLEEISEVRLQTIEQKVNVLVPALHIRTDVERVIKIAQLHQSLSSIMRLIKFDADGAARAFQPGTNEAEILEGLLQELKEHASETTQRVVEVPAAALRATGAAGERRYGSGQWLTVRQPDGGWADIQLTIDGAPLGRAGLEPLHPWNHAPRELPQQDFEMLRDWWLKTLVAKHSDITDALTGKRLDVLQQCVAINMIGGAESAGIHDASSLSSWLHSCHAARCKGDAVDLPAAALLTGPPAAGKTSLMSQVRLRFSRFTISASSHYTKLSNARRSLFTHSTPRWCHS